MSLNDVVTLNISRSAPAVSREGFGTQLILGSTITSAWGSDRIRSYTDPADMLTDGFMTSSPEYKRALAAFSQKNKPTQVKVGRRSTPVAQVETFTPNVTTQAIQHYIVTINGVAYDFTSDASPTAAEVVTGLAALISADSNAVVAPTGTNTLILTAIKAGISFVATSSTNLPGVTGTASVGIDTDLPLISAEDDDWYALVCTTTDNDETLLAAATIEAYPTRKTYVQAQHDTAVIATGSTDFASRLMAKSFARTFPIYSADVADGPDSALMGLLLPLQPGSATAKFKTLAGIAVDNLSQSQFNFATAKNCNVYTQVGGVGIVQEGVVASGEFWDVIIGIDWLYANMQADVFQVLVNNDKIPYTDNGAALIEGAIRTRLNLAVTAGILAEGTIVVTVPKVADQDPADKAARKMGGITFSAELAGAVHKVVINGNVYV